MPKVGQEPLRRAALVSATISEIGRAGSLDVTVGQIARRAGMSTALAHYYFSTKDAIFLAAMRHILTEFGLSARRHIRKARGPLARIDALIGASLDAGQFRNEVVAAWLVFYVEAQRSEEASRLLRIYVRRLHSNLVFDLSQLTSRARAERVAQGIGALIDGIYIREALRDDTGRRGPGPMGGPQAADLVHEYLRMAIAAQ